MLRNLLLLSLLIGSSLSYSQVKDDDSQSEVIPYDFAPDYSDSIISARIASIDSDIPVTFNPTVRRFIDHFTLEKRWYFEKMLYRHKEYFPMFEEKLKAHGLPTSLKYLTIVESGINPQIKSPAGALGLWQFMPYTGKSYKLNYDYYVDERMDPEKSTEAACLYLKELYRMFGDWELALASYNCGPGNVRKAIRRSGYKKGFWEIYDYLPKETRSYVPQFMASIYIMNFHEEHNIHTNKVDYVAEHKSVMVNRYINFELLASELEMCTEELIEINPEIKRNAIDENHFNYLINIPTSKMEHFRANEIAILDSCGRKGLEAINYGKHKGSRVVKVVHVVRRGDVLGKIADQYHVRLSELRGWNNISSRNIIHIGQRLEIYTTGTSSTTTTRPNVVVSNSVPPKFYIVKRGDNLWTISRRFTGLSIAKIKQLNGLTSDELKIGQKLKLS